MKYAIVCIWLSHHVVMAMHVIKAEAAASEPSCHMHQNVMAFIDASDGMVSVLVTCIALCDLLLQTRTAETGRQLPVLIWSAATARLGTDVDKTIFQADEAATVPTALEKGHQHRRPAGKEGLAPKQNFPGGRSTAQSRH